MEVKKKRKRFSRIIRWILSGILILLALFIVSAFVLAKYYEEAIKKLFITELNKRLTTEIAVRDVNFTFLRQFPYGTLEFTGLSAKDAISKVPKDTLLKAEKLQLHFNILDLYHKKYVIKRIDLQDAEVKLKIYNDLSDNFHCWKKQEGTASGNFAFALDKVVLHNVKVVYSNTPSRQYYSMLLKSVRGKGKFSEDLFDLKLTGDLLVTELRSKSQVFVHNKKASVNLAMSINQKLGQYRISRGEVSLARVNFSAGGKITYTDTDKTLDLHFTTADADLGDIINELPARYAKSLKEYDLKGKMLLKANITGKFGGKDLPFVDTRFSVEKGSVTYSKENIALENLTLSGTYKNFTREKKEGSELRIENVQGMLNKGSFSGRLQVDGNGPSMVVFDLKADLDVSELLRFLPEKKIESATGDFKIRMAYKGEVKSFESVTADDFTAGLFSCELDLNGISWEIKDQPYKCKDFNGALSFNNNDVVIHKLNGVVNGNSFSTQGYFQNIVPFLMSKSEDLQVKASLSSPALDLKALLTEKKSGTDTTFLLLFPERWNGEISLNLGKLDFGHFHGEKVNCNLRYSGRKLYVNQLTFNAAGGGFTCDGIIDGSSNRFFDISVDVRINKVDINRLFYNFGNFGQNYILAENLKGIVSSDIQCSFRMSQKLAIDPASITASIDTYAEQGELINYSAISGLGKFIRVDDLSRIKFSTLSNTIFIRKKMVIIPSMDVQSDAVNFTISGTHSFNNEINYHFRLLLSDILSRKAKKAKKENEEFGIEQEDEVGRTTLFILLTGTVDHPVFRYDSKSVKGKIVSSFLNEKMSLKQSLKKEFSRSRKEQDSLSLREEHIMKKQENGKFVVDWENSLKDSLDVKKKESRKARRAEKKQEKKSLFKVEWEEPPQK